MDRTRFIGGAVALLTITTAFAACDGDDLEPGSVSVLLTDAAGDVAEARIVIDEVSIIGSTEDEDSRGIVLSTNSFEGDLLDLENTFVTLVDEVAIPAGSYNQVRLVISDGCIVTEAGEVFATDGYDACGPADGRLQMPSFAQSGLKINLPPDAEVTGEGRRVVLLDFNVADSFGSERGNSNMWVMTPVVHATGFALSSDVLASLVLADTVTLPEGIALTDFAFTLDGESPLFVAEDGIAELLLLIPGDHTLDLVAPAPYVARTDPDMPFTFTLDSDEDLSLDFTITSLTDTTSTGSGG